MMTALAGQSRASISRIVLLISLGGVGMEQLV
jgi:hypothetical protein